MYNKEKNENLINSGSEIKIILNKKIFMHLIYKIYICKIKKKMKNLIRKKGQR